MKKLFLLILIIAVAAVWWLKRGEPRSPNLPTPANGTTDLNDRIQALPPHLQRKALDYLSEAGRFGADGATTGQQVAAPVPQTPKISRLRAATAELQPELRKKIEDLPPSVRQKALDMLGEARQHQSQP